MRLKQTISRYLPITGFSRELAVPRSKLALLFNAAFCRRDQSLSY
jgi:hypothetical protein